MSENRPSLAELETINPRLAEIASEVASGGLTPADALRRLPSRYFEGYNAQTVARHLELLCSLSLEEPYALDARRGDDGVLELTITSIDEPGLLSLLAGILGASGFDIVSGTVFTLERETSSSSVRPRRGRRPTAVRRVLPTRRIVDRFEGRLVADTTPDRFFSALTSHLDAVIPLILPGGDHDEARRLVNEAVADRLRADEASVAQALYPIDIAFDSNDSVVTRMIITGEDTPFFLYSLSTALSLQNISIESVTIETRGHVISDEFELLDRGATALDAASLDRIRFSVLLTKQFTYFLDRAPDPYAALVRFESMSRDLMAQTENSGIDSLLSRPLVLRELAQLLGTSDFLWEDFIRLQYENIIPMLNGPSELSSDRATIEHRIGAAISEAETVEDKRRVLNEFKDRETFLVDLDHILNPDRDFFFLSNRLSDLAEIIVHHALEITQSQMALRYGRPRTVAGLETSFAVFGLGKLGGRALGYASDIELMFVYRDGGTTDGAESITNAEYFERFFVEASGSIESKREGIFSVDLRLRPHGKSGPHAVSLESFNRYYGRDGEAHSYEKLALTRLRYIAGDTAFGAQVEELRDDLIFAADSIDLSEIRALRRRQFEEKTKSGRLNAKFSPGALVDLEYGLQILLVQHGRTNRRLRTPSLHAGLEELERSGVMDAGEAQRLVRSYRFLRKLINGLRMLRGNAQDLFLPAIDSLEYAHLARRAGYDRDGDLSAAEQLHIDFEARTAAVRAFLEHHLGRESIPGQRPGNAADLVLSPNLPTTLREKILEDAGIHNHERALRNIASLTGADESKDVFTELVILVWQALRSNIDPDMALNNWDRYVSRLDDRTEHYRRLLRQPRMLDLMLQVFASSHFLAETLIQEPPFLEWALDQRNVSRERTAEDMVADMRLESAHTLPAAPRRSLIRRWRKREILRIGTRDICLKTDLATITAELSALAGAIIAIDLEAIWNELDVPRHTRERFCLLAFGKLGGRELNYSSDVDLLGVYEDGETDTRENDVQIFSDAMNRLRADLSEHTPEGYAYRVDFRLRPYGSAGPLVQSLASLVRYYEQNASGWEHQALIKLAPVAGNKELGLRFLDAVRPVSILHFESEQVRRSIRRLRLQAVRQTRTSEDIKSGEGGIRDIEFLVQGLQMIHSSDHPETLTGHTLTALSRLGQAGVISPETVATLGDDYKRLRRVEHYLQIYEDRQIHALPGSDVDRTALARRLDGPQADVETLTRDLTGRRGRIRAYFERFLETGSPDPTDR